MLGFAPPLAKSARGLELKDDPRVRIIELLEADRPPAACRVVQIDEVPPKAFDDEEVIHVPEHDKRRPELAELVGRHLVPLARQPVLLGGLLDIEGVAAVSRHPALDAQLLEWDMAAMVRQNDAERGRAALGRFHLQDGWRSHAAEPSFLDQIEHGRTLLNRLSSSGPCGSGQSRPISSLNQGIARAIKGRRSTTIDAEQSVPLEMG